MGGGERVDYFSETGVGVGGVVPVMGMGLADHVAWYRRRRRRLMGHVAVSLVFLSSVLWFAWGYVDEAQYAFASPRAPLIVGAASSVAPSDLVHNAYIEIEGITEHRGMEQALVRGLGLQRETFWYFRLLGSRGLFIEVPPDAERFGTATQVKVAGRVVDPALVAVYEPLLAAYRDRFVTQERPAIRILQVDVNPGEGRLPYMIALVAVGLLVLLNGLTLWRLSRHMRRPVVG